MASIRKDFPTAPRPAWLVWCAAGIVLLVASMWGLSYAAAHSPSRGMHASVYRDADATDAIHAIAVDHALDPVAVAREAGLDPERAFLIEWDGIVTATEEGLHHLRVRVDDGVAVWVNGRLLLEHVAPGRHDLSAPVHLDRGLHRLRIRYTQLGGDAFFRLSWARPSWREHFVAVPVAPPTPEMTFAQVDKALSYPTAIAVACSLWLLCGLALGFWTCLDRIAGDTVAADARSTLALAAVALAFLGFGIHIGAAPWRGWVPDELVPADFLYPAQEWFVNGWAPIYPPVHLYLTSFVISPFLALASADWLDIGDYDTQVAIHIVGRALTVVMAALTLLVTAIIAAMTIGRRLTVLAPFLLLTAPPFVFYSKTMNLDVPYVLWVSLGMLMFLRSATTRKLSDHVWLGAVAAIAVATKDQAYGYFVGAAAILLVLTWREPRHLANLMGRTRALVSDRRLWAGAVTCIVVYAFSMGALWNVNGVFEHYALITGGGSLPFRMFPQTPAGMGQLAAATLSILPSAMGPFCTLFGVVGAVAVARRPRDYRPLLWLLVIGLGYLATFVAVVGYVYDRFLLGLTIPVVLLAAVGFDTMLRAIPSPRARRLMTIGLLLCALWPSALLNWRLAADSRLQVEDWMASNVSPDALVVGSGISTYLPNLHPFRHLIETQAEPDAILQWEPDVVVLNEQWLNRSGRSEVAQVAWSLEEAGYHQVFAAGRRDESAWGDPLGRDAADVLFSNLDKVDPPLSVWRRLSHRPAR